jgi:hypothetical protein
MRGRAMTYHQRRAKRREWPSLLQTARHYRRVWEGGARGFRNQLMRWDACGRGGIMEEFWAWRLRGY